MINKHKNLFICLVAVTLCFYGCSNKARESIPNDNTEQTSYNNITETENNQKKHETTTNNKIQSEKIFDENTENSDFSLTEVQYDVKDNDFNRPSSINGNEVFIGWKEYDKISKAEENSLKDNEIISLTAQSEDISDTENAIYNDTVYAEKTSEYVIIPVIIGGNTDFSVLELEISFDKNTFAFDSFSYTDEDAICNCTEEGKIFISFVSTSNISGQVNICNIKLKNISFCSADTSLEYNVKDIAKWNDDKTDYIDVSYEIVNNKIVIY